MTDMHRLNRQGRSRPLAVALDALEAHGHADEVSVIRCALIELKRENARRREIAKHLADLNAALSASQPRGGTDRPNRHESPTTGQTGPFAVPLWPRDPPPQSAQRPTSGQQQPVSPHPANPGGPARRTT